MVLNVQNIPTLELGQAQMFSGNFPPCSLSYNGRCNPVGNDGSGQWSSATKVKTTGKKAGADGDGDD